MSGDGAPARRFGILTAVRLGRDPGGAADEEQRRRADAIRRGLVEQIRAAAASPGPSRRGARRRTAP